jgi:hypothetical protein
MRFRKPRFVQRQHRDVIPGLTRLYVDPELQEARSLISDMLIYAEIGKDRRTLGPEFVAKTERLAREHIDRTRTLREALASAGST